jgi:hypothetical protein
MGNCAQASVLSLQPIGPCTTLPLFVTAMARRPGTGKLPVFRAADYNEKKTKVKMHELHQVVTELRRIAVRRRTAAGER